MTSALDSAYHELATANARLRGENERLLAMLKCHNDAAAVEIERLRAALGIIRRSVRPLMPDGWSDALYVMQTIDRALGEEGDAK